MFPLSLYDETMKQLDHQSRVLLKKRQEAGRLNPTSREFMDLFDRSMKVLNTKDLIRERRKRESIRSHEDTTGD